MTLTHEQRAQVTIGYAVMMRALGTIGSPERTDSDLAKIVIDGELEIRALLDFALKEIASQ